jgi:hypothetical protein
MGSGWRNGSEVRLRSFAEIIAAEKQHRNILEIHLSKIATMENNVVTKVKPLTFDDLGEVIFDVWISLPTSSLHLTLRVMRCQQ